MPDFESPTSDPGGQSPATAIIVAAGRGERFGVAAKCLVPLAGRPLLAYSLDAVAGASSVDRIVVVVGEHTRPAVEDLITQARSTTKPVVVVTGGAERQHSVAHGLAATAPGVDVVVIHDGARPLVDARLFDRCVAAARSTGAAIAATPVVDTIKRVQDGRIVATVPRNDLWAAQTPQAFRRTHLEAALTSELARTRTFTDEAGLFEALGWDVEIVPGSPVNRKITVPADLAIAEAFLAANRGETVLSGPFGTAPVSTR